MLFLSILPNIITEYYFEIKNISYVYVCYCFIIIFELLTASCFLFTLYSALSVPASLRDYFFLFSFFLSSSFIKQLVCSGQAGSSVTFFDYGVALQTYWVSAVDLLFCHDKA